MGDALGIQGFDKVKSGGVVCQGNYLLPLSKLYKDHAHFLRSDGRKGKVWSKAQQYANEIVERLLQMSGATPLKKAPNLRGALAIYLLNSYWFTHLKSDADTVKDNWGQLPKTPVLDLVRALPADEKALLRQLTLA